MKIAVWRTGHEIADTVVEAVYEGLKLPIRYGKCSVDQFTTDMAYNQNVIEVPDIHIGYGILRGMDKVFKACAKAGKPWLNIDKGYFNPGHYDGYYRVSLCGTQQTTGLDKLGPDYARLAALGIEICRNHSRLGYTMLCPPTLHVANFFDIDDDEQWKYEAVQDLIYEDVKFITRYKGDEHPINWDRLGCVRTFNSSVGWDALRQGIPVTSDPDHSIVGAYQKMVAKEINMDYDERRKLFAIMAGLQLSLDEMRSGKLWPLIQRLLQSTSDLTPEKQLLPMSPLPQ